MLVKELLRSLDLGSSVAEFDADLKNYFIETQTFRAVVRGESDIIAGDKGTGKTALYKVLRDRYREYPELNGVEILPAFNPSGNPVFQRLGQIPLLNEGQYTTIWKSYLLSLVGNWYLELFNDSPTEKTKKLDEVLQKIGLRTSDDSAQTIFSKLVNLIHKYMNLQSAEVAFSLTEAGMPSVTPKVEFGKTDNIEAQIVPHEQTFRYLNDCLAEIGITVWVVLDRLDEAFQGYPEVERPALRALLRTYLELLEFGHLKLKLFVRKDLFRKIIHGGFVNLTHVNARRLDIVWDEEDLKSLLCRRIRRNEQFIKEIHASAATDDQLFYLVFPSQVDPGDRKPTTWTWMIGRIQDGNRIKPPRNIIDLAKKAQEAQQRTEEREARTYVSPTPLIGADAIRKALKRLSEDRVNDTLLAEASDLLPMIEKFRDGKAEHNVNSLAKILEITESDVKTTIKPLLELGFLEEIGESYKVPMLYRDGLNIKQGKAFTADNTGFEQANDEIIE